MEKKQWVQHISGQGEKWEIQAIQDPEWPSWVAPHTVAGGGLLYLPKSEYRLCEPPERLKDVTAECTVLAADNGIQSIVHEGEVRFVTAWKGEGYLLRKVQLETPHKCGKTLASNVWAFIVEQKVSQ